MLDALLPLLHYLDITSPTTEQRWTEWVITPITGGANNLLYRVTNGQDDYAVKFTVRDARNRAGREFAALTALQAAGLAIAPQAIGYDVDRFRQPVIVQSWLMGDVLAGPPQTQAEWLALLDHYCLIHSFQPKHTTVALAEAVLSVANGAAGKMLIEQQVAKLPLAARPASLQAILAWCQTWTPPIWPTPPRTLCRVDGNWRNFIRQPQGLLSVDWENSGWGDPAFELADLMTHPAYTSVDDSTWHWLIDTYAVAMHDPTAPLRIQTYYTLMLVWWLVRWARFLHEVPQGLDVRLVARSPHWQSETEQNYKNYLTKITTHLATF